MKAEHEKHEAGRERGPSVDSHTNTGRCLNTGGSDKQNFKKMALIYLQEEECESRQIGQEAPAGSQV